MSREKKHVHFIGICGTAMAPVAKMFLDLGWHVTGSDKGFFPPISLYLKQFPEIEFYPGFHPEKVGNPDLVVHGTIGPSNPELQYVIEQGIDRISYPEALERFVVKENSIVVVGTYGKSTISSLAAWALQTAGYDPSFMSAGMQPVLKDGVRSTNGEWSVIEGDEYPFDLANPAPKFFYYHPKYLILTAAAWDHMDVYKTEEAFILPFKKLVSEMPKDGLIVASKCGKNIQEIVHNAPCRVVYYDNVEGDDADYTVSDLQRDGLTTSFKVHNTQGLSEAFTASLIGKHMYENILAVVALLTEIGVPIDAIKKGVETFKTVRRRLEIRGESKNGAFVVDDLAHSPTKAKAGISALRHWFPEAKIHVVYEPNIGNRTDESIPAYDDAFGLAHEVIIPRLSIVKTKEGEHRLSTEELAEVISRTQPATKAIKDDDKLTTYVKENTQKGDIIAFMGAHGFRGMIEATLE